VKSRVSFLIGVLVGHHLEPERLGGRDAAVALTDRIGLVGGDEGDRLNPFVLFEILVDRRSRLIARHHPQHGVAGGLGVELFREGVGEIDDPRFFGDRTHGGGAVVDVGPDDIADAFLRHLLHAGDGALGILLVVEGYDVDIVRVVADLHPARRVPPVGERFHRAHI